MLISPFMVGIALGVTAKFADGREILYYFPILADIMGRFGIWVWAAALPAGFHLIQRNTESKGNTLSFKSQFYGFW